MLKKTVLALALATVAAAPASAATNLLLNGSFEQGTDGFDHWTLGGTTNYPPVAITYGSATGYPTGAFGEAVPVDNAVSSNSEDAGNRGAYFVSDFANPQTLSQAITLEAGKWYTVGFDIYAPANGNANAGDATLAASLNGVDFTTFTLPGLAATTWTHYETTIQALSNDGQFQFAFNTNFNPSKDFVIDKVFVSEAAVPEPATWAMMIAGFGLIGLSMRARSRKISFVAA